MNYHWIFVVKLRQFGLVLHKYNFGYFFLLITWQMQVRLSSEFFLPAFWRTVIIALCSFQCQMCEM